MAIFYTSATDRKVKPIHSAQSAWWGELGRQLTAFQGLRNIYLNDLGENTPGLFAPSYVAQLIKEGAVWVDWCAWPFASFGQSAIGQLFNNLGYSTEPNFTVDRGSSYLTPDTTLLDRALIVPQPVPRMVVVNNRVPHGTAHYGLNLINGTLSTVDYYYGSFAIRSGKGAYIYAYGNVLNAHINLNFHSAGVVPGNYVPFVLQVVASLPKAGVTTSPHRPSCEGKYGSYVGLGPEAGTYEFVRFGQGFSANTIVDSMCNVVGGPYYHQLKTAGSNPTPSGAPGSSTSGSGSVIKPAANGSTVTYNLNGQVYQGIMMNGTVYLLYTALDVAGLKYTLDRTKHTFTLSDGKIIQGVVHGGTTYIPSLSVPGIQGQQINGQWHFVVAVKPTDTKPANNNSSKPIQPQNLTFMLIAGGALAGLFFLTRWRRDMAFAGFDEEE